MLRKPGGIAAPALAVVAAQYVRAVDSAAPLPALAGTVSSASEGPMEHARLNPTSGRVIQYLLPTLAANIRRIDVDSRSNPIAVWIGAHHQAKLVRIEPLP